MTVRFAGQPIALVVADTKQIARRAAALVKVEYIQVAAPVLTIKDALKTQPDGRKQSVFCPLNVVTGDADAAMSSAPRRVTGEWEMGGQYHFTMEPHTVRVIPFEDGQLNIYSATQGIKHVVDVVSDVVKIPAHKINAEVRRLGGGYGGKVSNPIPIASACAVAATKLNRPVRMVLDIENMIEMCSGRFPFMISYEAGFDNNGKLLALKMHMITDNGFSLSTLGFLELREALAGVRAIYRTDNWTVTPGTVKTNLPINTVCRAPGWINGFVAIETVMRHIAHELNMDPWDVKKINFALGAGETPTPPLVPNDEKVFSMMVKEMFDKAEINSRKADIHTFNQANRWRKCSLALVPIGYNILLKFRYPALVSIYDKDGTVAVSHGGVEMGQGINTKVAQVVALVLGVPLELVSVKPNNSLINPNDSNYYPPTHKDMPRDFRVKLLKNNKNDMGIFNSKATGEPAVCMSNACLMALHQAVTEARKDAGLTDWININTPSTAEYTQMACQTSPEMLVIT